MKTSVHDIWPTKIVLTDNLLEEEYISSMKNELIKKSLETPRENWQSGPALHQENKFKPLCKKVLELAEWHLKTHYHAVYKELVITDMWGNILKEKEFHKPHNHSNNVISGVFYLQADDVNSSKIWFMDPRQQAGVISPEVSEFTHINSALWQYPSVTNRCLLFPSWLSHFVEGNRTKEDRISVAFNFMYKGKVGLSEYYQSGEF